MKRCMPMISVIVLIYCANVCAETLHIRALQYNIKHTEAGATAVGNIIAATGADIVGLEETTAGNAAAIASRLTTATGKQWYSQAMLGSNDIDAIVSRYRIIGTTHITMFSDGDFYGAIRTVLQVTVEVPDSAGQPHRLQFFVTHLSTREGTNPPRSRQCQELVDFCKMFPGPRVVVGDFNLDDSRGGSDLTDYQKFTSSSNGNYTDAYRQINPTAAGKTIPVPSPTKRFDYVFYSRAAGFNAVASDRVINSSTNVSSDHYPVFADFDWDGNTFNNPPAGEPLGSGSILREYWNNVTGGTIASLTSNPAFPSTPSGSEQLTWYLQSKPNSGDNYGQRIRGLITAPTTGSYYFWVTCDSEAEVWLSTDSNPANKSRIAWITGATTLSCEWSKYPTASATIHQQSNAISLVAGQRYYIEVLHKEGTGNDNLAVGWKLPNGTYERPIAARRLSPPGNVAPKIGSAATATPNSAQTGEIISFTVAASDPNGDALSYSWNFGDGSPAGSGASTTHVYPAPGDYLAQVTVTDGHGGSANSSVVVSVNEPPSALPSPWLEADIGAVGASGSATFSSGTFTINGGGSDIWANSDSFHYVYQTLNGDGQIIADLTGLTNPSGANWSMAAVMIREKLTADSIHAAMMITTDGKAKFRRRTVVGGTTASDGPTIGTTYPPRWLKLTRVGNVFTAYISTNGSAWTQIHTPQTVTMGANAYIGLMVLRNGATASTTTGTFTNVSVTP